MSNKFMSLTKENFWNDLQEKHPDQMKVFCDWIDQYKQRVRFDKLFNYAMPHYEKQGWHNPKYHDLPIAMQIGIFIQFCMETPHRYQLIESLPVNMERMAEIIKTFFDQEHDFPLEQPEPVFYSTPNEIVNKILDKPMGAFEGATDPETI